MFKNVLVGVDGRPNGRDAIALACQLTDPDGKLTLTHVHRGEVAEEHEDSRKLLNQERTGAEVEAEVLSVVSSSPGRGLHEQAEAQNADLIVVGSCRHGVFGRAMLGDNTRAALNGASCAVALAPHGYAENPHPIEKVGVGYNDSPESKAALALARELAAQRRATVRALEVVPIATCAYGVWVPPVAASIEAMAQETNRRSDQLPDIEGDAVYGMASEELASFGDEVDILIVGSRGYGPMRRLVLASTCAYLQRHARCSLLVLPRGATSAGGDSTTSS